MQYRSLFPLAFLVASLAQAQDLTQPVTYRTVAVPASKAIADLAKATHVDLGVTAPLDSQPLIICLKDVPLKEAMDKIAAVLHGRWSQNKTAFTLQRPDDIQEALTQAVYQERLAQLTKSVNKRLSYRAQTPFDAQAVEADLRKQKKEMEDQQKEMEKQAAAGGPPNATVITDGQMGDDPSKMTQEQMEAMQKKWQKEQDDRRTKSHANVNGRLKDRILAGIDLTVLASLPEERKVVFSTNPRPLEYKLNLSDDDMQAIANEQNAFTTAQKRVFPNDDEMNYYSDRKMLSPSDFRIVAQLQGNGPGIGYMQIYVLNNKGQQLVSPDDYGPGFDGAFGDDFMLDYSDYQRPAYEDFSKLNMPAIALSPISRELTSLERLQAGRSDQITRPPSPELKALLLDAPNHDPLSFAVSEILMGAADGKSWNLVASPADSNEQYATYMSEAAKVEPQNFLMAASEEANVVAKDGWITLSPKHPLQVEEERTDRASLSALLSAIVSAGYPTIEDVSAFAAANRSGVDQSLAQNLISLFSPNTAIYEMGDWHALRFLGLLSNDEAQAMINDKKVQVTSLHDEEQQELNAIVLNGASATGSDDFKGVQDDEDMMMSQQDEAITEATAATDETATDDQSAYLPLEDDPFEILAGLPDPASTVSLADRSTIAVRMHTTRDPNDTNMSRQSRFADYGDMYMGSSDRWVETYTIASYEARKNNKRVITYASCGKRQIQLKLRLSNKIEIAPVLSEFHNDMTPFGPLSKLPKAVLDRVEKMKGDMGRYGAFGSPDSEEQPAQPVKAPPPPRA